MSIQQMSILFVIEHPVSAGSAGGDEDNTDITSCVAHSKFTYGTPIFQMFYSMMRETDKKTFYIQLEVFRKTCKAYNQLKLLEYFEDRYFRENRIIQWARWYRLQMYQVEWILDNNIFLGQYTREYPLATTHNINWSCVSVVTT